MALNTINHNLIIRSNLRHSNNLPIEKEKADNCRKITGRRVGWNLEDQQYSHNTNSWYNVVTLVEEKIIKEIHLTRNNKHFTHSQFDYKISCFYVFSS